MPFTVTLPKLSPTMEEGQIAKWHKKEGEFVEANDLLLEISTDKATVEHNALDPGYLRKILIKEGSAASVNDPIAIFSETADESIEGYLKEKPKKEEKQVKKEKKPAKKEEKLEQSLSVTAFTPEAPLKESSFSFPTNPLEKRMFVTPLAKKLAKEKGIDLSTIKGTGPGGRVTKEDLPKGQKDTLVTFGHRETPKHAPGSFEEEQMSPMRKAIATKLQQAKSFVPHFYVSIDVDCERLIQSREELMSGGLKLTFNDYMIRASAVALKHHPEVNSGYHGENDSIIRFQTIDVAVAVTLPEGLITPIIRHADLKNLGELSVEMKDLASRAKKGKLEEHEYKGGSFTVSNLGMFGVKDFQAILNPPQAAILAVSGIRNEAVIKEGRIIPGKRMTLTLSCDHRVIDGVSAATFLQTIKDLLENPTLLIV